MKFKVMCQKFECRYDIHYKTQTVPSDGSDVASLRGLVWEDLWFLKDVLCLFRKKKKSMFVKSPYTTISQQFT